LSSSPGGVPLTVGGVTKRYHQTVALDNVSFAVEGGVFGLLGANGAGKSTLLKLILGLASPDQGEIKVFGVDPRRDPIEAKRQVGYLPEDLRLYERLTGHEFLEFVAGIKQAKDGAERQAALEYFGLAQRQDELIGEYSMGMKKKIGIIAALIGNPRLVLFDEPLNGLDAESMRLLRLRIEEQTLQGATFVISSHVMGFVERMCERAAVLRKGTLVIEGSPADLRAAAGMSQEPFDDVFLHFAL
jgi:ABC-2 type transport system ATP-binding protein